MLKKIVFSFLALIISMSLLAMSKDTVKQGTKEECLSLKLPHKTSAPIPIPQINRLRSSPDRMGLIEEQGEGRVSKFSEKSESGTAIVVSELVKRRSSLSHELDSGSLSGSESR